MEVKQVKKFDKCPHCGCPDTIYRKAAEKEIEAKKLGENAPAFSNIPNPNISITYLNDPQISPVVKLLIKHYDTCYGCGIDYCVLVYVSEGLMIKANGGMVR